MNCIIGQSGGPTSVINSSLAGAISQAIDMGFDHIYGSLNGIEGIIKGRIVEIDKDTYKSNGVEYKLCRRPSSILGSCRYKLPDNLNDKVYEDIFTRLKDLEITSFIYIGGNDSMDTVMKLNNYMDKASISNINIVGIPKTIDNDLCEMDHSPGYSSAAKYVMTTLKSIRADVDIYDLKSVTIVEIMGRNAGWLAASALVTNTLSSVKVVDLLYLSEHQKSKEDIIEEIEEAFEINNNLILAVSEGFMDKDKYFEQVLDTSFDRGFNHPRLGGVAENMSTYIKNQLGVKTRAVELNIVQRSNPVISLVDSKEAFYLGQKALEISAEKTNIIPILKRRHQSGEYSTYIDYVKPVDIANKEKMIPTEWLGDNRILQEKMSQYLLPLIQGHVDQYYEDGLIQFIDLEDFII